MAIKSLDSETFSGFKNFKAGIFAQEIYEGLVDVTQSSNTTALDYGSGNIFFQTNAFSAAATINITNAPTINGSIFTVTLITPTANATTSRPNTLNVNGSAVTIRWAAGTVPNATTTASKLDIWSFTLFYRSSAFTSLVTAQLNY